MPTCRLKIGDQNLGLYLACNSRVFPALFSEADGPLAGNLFVERRGYYTETAPQWEGYSNGAVQLTIQSKQSDSQANFLAWSHLGLLTGVLSEKYWFAHAAGIIINDQGFLLLGNGGSGKTYMSSTIADTVLSDDAVLVSDNEIRTIGSLTTLRSYSGDSLGRVRMAPADVTTTSLDHVVLMDRNRADYSRSDVGSISPDLTFDNAMHPALLEYHRQGGAIPYKGVMHHVGTANLEHAAEIIKGLANGD